MNKTNFDLTLELLKENRPCYDQNGRFIDIDLICNLLRLKYNSIEAKEVVHLLVQRINNCIDN